jgi:hypothetical protein
LTGINKEEVLAENTHIQIILMKENPKKYELRKSITKRSQ